MMPCNVIDCGGISRSGNSHAGVKLLPQSVGGQRGKSNVLEERSTQMRIGEIESGKSGYKNSMHRPWHIRMACRVGFPEITSQQCFGVGDWARL